MKRDTYTIGLDFGTLSARALLVRTSDGLEIGSAVFDYPHAVMDETLITPHGAVKLPPDFALQHPQDYFDALDHVLPALLKQYGVSAEDIIGIGVDFTTCTLIPTDRTGTPICFDDRFADNPHAYVKLWKHHAGEPYAERMTELASERGEFWLGRYGGRVSSEWMLPKVWETLDKAPDVYDAAAYFVDAGDWVVWQLTGNLTRNTCITGYKALYQNDEYPSAEFLSALDLRLAHIFSDKLSGPVTPVGTLAGRLTEQAAARFGLRPGISVAAAVSDAHVTAPSLKVTAPGQMAIVMGTSSVHMLVSEECLPVPGVCGVVRDGLIPGYYGYEAGQTCVGDHFAWFADTLCPADYKEEAAERGISPIALLTEKADKQKPGQSGILALDWWNGNRSVLADFDLSGLFLGMNLNTQPEDLFRALVEATAYGTRMIIENYRRHGAAVDEIRAAGGIAVKNPFIMQIYADVTGMEIRIAGSAQCPSLGSAIFAAYAAGSAAGGYDSLAEAAETMGSLSDRYYRPIPENKAVYDQLYAEYERLHDYFGRGGNDVMKRLRKIRAEQNA
jgi:L-ribulokinase